MFNKKLMLLAIFIITGLIQCKTQAIIFEESLNHSPDYNFSFFQNPLFELSKKTTFFKALLQNNDTALFASYLLDSPKNLQFKVLLEPQQFKRSINLYLYRNNISLPQSIYDIFCNPLHNNNLIQLIYYADEAGLSVIEVEKIRLLSLAIYAPDVFHAIAQIQSAIQFGNFYLVNHFINHSIRANWIVAYAGKSQLNKPIYNYVTVNNTECPIQDWHA